VNKIISIVSGKGGVGKTTFVSNLILALSIKFNKKILVIDMDIGNLFLSLGLKEHNFNVDLIDTLEDNTKLSSAIYNFRKNLYFLGLNDRNILKTIPNDTFSIFMNKLKTKFDYIILDVGAGINENFKKSIYVSDLSIVIIDSTMLSYKISEKTVKKMKEINNKLNAYLVINKYDIELAKKGILISKDDVIKSFKVPLIGVVPYNIKNITFLNKGIPYYLNKDDDTFYTIYNKIANRIIEKSNY